MEPPSGGGRSPPAPAGATGGIGLPAHGGGNKLVPGSMRI
jgi:hypothetical protein